MSDPVGNPNCWFSQAQSSNTIGTTSDICLFHFLVADKLKGTEFVSESLGPPLSNSNILHTRPNLFAQSHPAWPLGEDLLN